MSVSSNIAESVQDPVRPAPSAPEDGTGESLRRTYDRYFKVILAESDKHLDWSYRLRYQVYCLENQYESASDNANERETDEYDRQSEHALLIHRETGTVVGTTRLIMPKVNGKDLFQPIHQICPPDILAELSDRIPVSKTAEISRFAIAKEFRRRAEDKGTITGGLTNMGSDNPRRLIPHISLGLIQSIVAMAQKRGMTHIYAVMEPALLRMLRGLGIHWEKLGPVVDYHGRRQPCFCDLDQLLATTWDEHPEVWEVMTDEGRIWPLNPEKTSNGAISRV